jgi:pimeloyl-ACP methyl ester carboxylesterase
MRSCRSRVRSTCCYSKYAACFVLVVAFRGMDQLIPNLSKFVPNLRRTLILPGCGHWTQQERPREVNAAMVDFLRGLGRD